MNYGLLVFLSLVVGGVGNWLRASSLFQEVTGRGATTARILCLALPLGLLSYFSGLLWWEAAIFGTALFLGSIGGWWGSLDLSRNEGSWIKDAILHTLRGAVWVAPVALVLLGLGFSFWWLALVPTLFILAAYELGWKIDPPAATTVGDVLFGISLGFFSLFPLQLARGIDVWNFISNLL